MCSTFFDSALCLTREAAEGFVLDFLVVLLPDDELLVVLPDVFGTDLGFLLGMSKFPYRVI